MNCQYCQNETDPEMKKDYHLVASNDISMDVTFNTSRLCLSCFRNLGSIMLEFLGREIRKTDDLDSVKGELQG